MIGFAGGRSALKISVVGCGYVGLVTGGCLAEIGHQVVCTDNDAAKIETLQAGKLPIYEPHLDSIVEKCGRAGRLRFSAQPAEAVREARAIFICVGTPPLDTGDADLSAIDNVARLIATEARTPMLVVEKSTVPAQTGQQVERQLGQYRGDGGAEFRVARDRGVLREGPADQG